MRVNGEQASLEKKITLALFLEKEGYRAETVAVQLNGGIVPKAAYDTVELDENAELEIMHFVGGG